MEELLNQDSLKIDYIPQWMPFSRSSTTWAGKLYNQFTTKPLQALRQTLNSIDSGIYERTDHKNIIWTVNTSQQPEVVKVNSVPITPAFSPADALLLPEPSWVYDGILKIYHPNYQSTSLVVTGDVELTNQDLDYRVYLVSDAGNVVWLDPRNEDYPTGEYTAWYAVSGTATIELDNVPYSYEVLELHTYWDDQIEKFGLIKKYDSYTIRGQLQALTYLKTFEHKVSNSIFPAELSLWDLITTSGDTYDSDYWYPTTLETYKIILENPYYNDPYVYLNYIPEGKVELTFNNSTKLYTPVGNKIHLTDKVNTLIQAIYTTRYYQINDNPIFDLGEVPVEIRPLFKLRKIVSSTPLVYLSNCKWGIQESVIGTDSFI